MVWNASRPADSDLIRLSAGLIRDNFSALEIGTVPFDTISLQSQGATPAYAGHNRLYGYNNVNSGQVEVCSVNPAGNTVLLTEGGKLGSIIQDAVFANASMGTFTLNGIANTQNAFCNAWVVFDSGANVLSSYNVTSVSSLGTGLYEITFSITFSSANYAVLATPKLTGASTHNRTCMVSAQTTTKATVRGQRIDQSGSSFVDVGMSVCVFGGR